MSDYVKRLAGPFTGEGDTSFTFGFYTYAEDEIYVGTAMSNDEATTILKLGVDYNVTLNDDQSAVPGGTVTLLTPGGLKAGEVLVIGSAMPDVKVVDLTNFPRSPPSQIDTEVNRLVIMIQQIVEETGRTLKVPATSSETPDDMIERLLAAQPEAQKSADAAAASAEAAEQSKDDAAEILEKVEEASDNADKILPYADDLSAVADNIDSVKATGGSITNVNIVAGDLESETQSADLDYGDYDDESGSGEIEVPTGGNIKTVADNITAVQKVGQNMDSILAIEDKIDGLDQTVAEMEAAVTNAETAEAGAESSATQAAKSATNAANQVTIAKDWAIKLDGKVQEGGVEIDFSAKYWANQAKGSADAATATLTQVTQAGETAVGNVQSAQTTAVSAVNTAGTTQVGNVNTAGQTQVSAVAAEGTKQIGLVEAAGDSAVGDVNAAGSTQVSAVNSAGATQTANAKAQADAAAQSASEALQSKNEAVAAQSAAESAKDAAVTAQGAAETANTNAQAAKTDAEAAAGTATSKATEASGYATTASNAKTAAESARDAAQAAKEAAEQIAGEIGDPLGKTEAANTYLSKTDASTTYATKTEVTTGLSGKANSSHTHTIANVTGLQDALDGKQASGDYATNTALTEGLAGKANTGHTHEIANVNGLQAALDGKQPSGSYAEATHTHTASQVTDLGTLAIKDQITAAELAATIDYGEYADA